LRFSNTSATLAAMKRQEAIELRPYSARFYIAALTLSILLAWTDIGITHRHPPTDSWAQPPLLIILFLYAAQAISRMLLPVASAKLSHKLASYSNLSAILPRTLGLAAAGLLFVGLIRGSHSELRLLGNTFILSPLLAADLFGKDSPYARPIASQKKQPILDLGSPQLLRLERIKRILGWISFAMFITSAAAVGATHINQFCSCERHPILFMVWLASALVSILGYAGVSAYIRALSPGPSRRSEFHRRPDVTKFKPLTSEHWGEHHVRTEKDDTRARSLGVVGPATS
jgi:hypothetical protein